LQINNTPKSSLIKFLEYHEEQRLLKITFHKGRFKYSGQTRELQNTSYEIYRNIIGAESVGRAILELLGERKYIRSQKKEKSLLNRLLNF
jgi:hypothetical protein